MKLYRMDKVCGWSSAVSDSWSLSVKEGGSWSCLLNGHTGLSGEFRSEKSVLRGVVLLDLWWLFELVLISLSLRSDTFFDPTRWTRFKQDDNFSRSWPCWLPELTRLSSLAGNLSCKPRFWLAIEWTFWTSVEWPSDARDCLLVCPYVNLITARTATLKNRLEKRVQNKDLHFKPFRRS